MRKALVETATGKVVNVIRLGAAAWPVPDGYDLVDAQGVGAPGDTWDGSQFITPPVVKPTVITFLAFLERLTEAEHEAVITWMRTAHARWEAAFERAKARNQVDLVSQKTEAFMDQLVTDAVLTQARRDEILTP